MFSYPDKQRLTAKFLSTERARLVNHIDGVMGQHGASADLIEANVVRSGGRVYACATIVNGSGPTPVKPIIDELHAVGIICTPVTRDQEDGRYCTRFQICAPEKSWTLTGEQS